MGTLAFILLIMGVAVLPFIGVCIILFGAILFENTVCLKIGLYLFLSALICFMISCLITDGINGKKTAGSETEIVKEKIVKVAETKKEMIIDTTIVIKNGVADTTFTYKFRK